MDRVALFGLLVAVSLVCCRAFDLDTLAPNINKTLEVNLDSTIELLCPNLTEKVGLYHIFEDQYKDCSLPNDKNFYIGECERGSTLYLVIRSFSASLDNLPMYDVGKTFYYGLYSSDGNSNDTCTAGFRFKVFITDPNAPKPSSTIVLSSTAVPSSTIAPSSTVLTLDTSSSLLETIDPLGSGYTSSSDQATLPTTTPSVSTQDTEQIPPIPPIPVVPEDDTSSASSLRHLNIVTITFLVVSLLSLVL